MRAGERLRRVFNFEDPGDRLPMIEWAPWWDQTVERWRREGLPADLPADDLARYFGLDVMECVMAGGISAECPKPKSHGAPVIWNETDYEAVRPAILNEALIQSAVDRARALKKRLETEDFIVRLWLDGFFWFPRCLLGIENHFFAFTDQPALLRRINADLADFNVRAADAVLSVLTPDMAGFAEDMSYNHGPMLSYPMFREFMLPYYQKVIPRLTRRGVKVLADSDGNVTRLIPWLIEAGIEGVYPLERQAEVDIAEIRRQYPRFLLMGAYDKMVMSRGEDAMRGEFERLLPVMRTGGFIPSVDHQTPPEVSLQQYRDYVRLFGEYTRRVFAEGGRP